MLRKHTFAPRMVVELRDDRQENGQSLLALVDSVELVEAGSILRYRDGREEAGSVNTTLKELSRVNSISLRLPQSKSRELKIWVHQLTPEGEIGTLPAACTLRSGAHEDDWNYQPHVR